MGKEILKGRGLILGSFLMQSKQVAAGLGGWLDWSRVIRERSLRSIVNGGCFEGLGFGGLPLGEGRHIGVVIEDIVEF